MREHEEEQKIDALNKELYYKNRKFNYHKRKGLHHEKIDVRENFEHDDFDELLERKEKYTLPTSFFKKIFYGVFILFIVSSFVAFLALYKGKKTVTNDLISMEILGQPFVDGGEPLDLVVRIQNFNDEELELPDLLVSYPIDKNSGEKKVIRRSLPNIKKGERVEEKFELQLYGEEGDRKKITSTLEYRVKGSSSIFVKEASHDVIIRSTPTQVIISAPEKVIHGQEMITDISIIPNTEKELRNILVKIDYPEDFEFIGANPEPSFSDNIWFIPLLKKTGENIRIKGKVNALPGEAKSMHVFVGRQDKFNQNKIETIFNHIVHSFDVDEPFLDTKILVNGKNGSFVPVQSDDDIDVEINYKNTGEEVLQDIRLTAYLDGHLYQQDKVNALNAEYDSSRHKILWTKDTYDKFAELKPGDDGSVSFSLKTKDFLSDPGIRINPKLLITASVSALDSGGNIHEAKSVDSVEVRGISDIKVKGKSLYGDGPFKNRGPIPPKVGRKTTYTLLFQVMNNPNKLGGAILKTILPSYVRWTGKIYPSTEKKNIKYSASNGEIEWNMGDILPGVGVNGQEARELYVQVEAVPSLSHVGDTLDLTRDIHFEAKDSFTDTTVRYKKGPITSLAEDSYAVGGTVSE